VSKGCLLALGLLVTVACVDGEHYVRPPRARRTDAARARDASETILDILVTGRAQVDKGASRVASQATQDFQCAPDQIRLETVVAGDALFVGARGCGSQALYAVGTSSVFRLGQSRVAEPEPTSRDFNWHGGCSLLDPGCREGFQPPPADDPGPDPSHCRSTSVRVCAAALARCSAEAFAVEDIGGGRWETRACGQPAIWTPSDSGWTLNQ
jgi:hypothetical protein